MVHYVFCKPNWPAQNLTLTYRLPFSAHEDLAMPTNAPYCAAKGGIKMLIRAIAIELAFVIDGGMTKQSGSL